jgi:hypothetical protein
LTGIVEWQACPAAWNVDHPASLPSVQLHENPTEVGGCGRHDFLVVASTLPANLGKEGGPEPVLAKIGHETLAEMIGTTRSRVSVFYEQVPQVGVHRL